MRLAESSSHYSHCVRRRPHAACSAATLFPGSSPTDAQTLLPQLPQRAQPALEMLSLESDHYRHLPQMYHADAIRDMDIRPNVNSLDLASPPPSRQAIRNSQPLTPPITPARRVHPAARPLPRFIPIDHSNPSSPSSSIAPIDIPDDPPSSRLFLQVQQGSALPTRYLVVTGLPPEIPANQLDRAFSVSLTPFSPSKPHLTPPYSV